MEPVGITASEIYRTAYRAIVAAGKSRRKASAMQYSKIGEIGKENPMETKLQMKRAKKDYMQDLSNVSDPISALMQKANYYKTILQLNLNSGYRNAKKAINDAAKELYPRTYKQREKLIDSGKVSIGSTADTAKRLDEMNIKPDSLLTE